jgi:SAM-dependent methyltransferase
MTPSDPPDASQRTALTLALDDPSTTLQRRLALSRKPFLHELYRTWYGQVIRAIPFGGPEKILELGSGAGFFKEMLPDALASDVLFLPHLDLIARGEALPFDSGSLGGIVLIDVFHHIPQPRLFLSETARCLQPGGVLAMIEPWRTTWSSLIYRYFHNEPFSPEAKTWEFASTGPLSGANGALPWIVFERDRGLFEKEFPDLRIASLRLHTPFLYLLSGGFSFPTIVPSCSFRFWRNAEELLRPWMRSWAMFALIVLTRV